MLKTNITEELHQYALGIGLKEPTIARELRKYTQNNLSNHQMLTAPDQCQFMALLARLTNAKNYLEVGVFTGYSTMIMGLALKNINLLPQNCKIVAIDNNQKHLNIAMKFWQTAKIDDIITVLCDDAINALEKLHNKTKNENDLFDIAYIDANKSDYLTYYEYTYKLVRKGGIILIDNIFVGGRVINQDANNPKYVAKIAELNQFINKDKRVEISVLSIGDGLTIAYKI